MTTIQWDDIPLQNVRADSGFSSTPTWAEAPRSAQINVRRRAIIKMTRALVMNGVPSSKISKAIIRFACALETRIVIEDHPGVAWIVFQPSYRYEDQKSTVYPIRFSQELHINFAKLSLACEVYAKVVNANPGAWRRRRQAYLCQHQDEDLEVFKHPQLSDGSHSSSSDNTSATDPESESDEAEGAEDDDDDESDIEALPDLDELAREATVNLASIRSRADRWSPWTRVLMMGAGCAVVGPFGFGARPIDMPVSFAIGCVVGWIQNVLVVRHEGLRPYWETLVALIVGFLARFFSAFTRPGVGSAILGGGGGGGGGEGGTGVVVGYEDHVHVFCFSALAQSGIALLLPGYILLVGAIDLGYRRLLQATGRVVFVAFYSLWLGAGLTMGIWLFSVIWLTKHSHVDKLLTCDAAPADIPAQLQWLFDPVLGGSYYRLLIVWSFASVISLYNFATWKQLPAMLFVAVPGFATTFFAANAFSSVPHFASFFGTAASGTLGYLYAHFARQPAIVYLFTAIWLQVPSGLAANGGLYSGLKAAESIANVHGNGTTQAGAGLDHTRTHGDGQWGGKHIMDLYLGMLCVAIAVFFGLGVAKGVAAGIVWVWETFRVRVLRRKRSRKVGGAQFGF